MAKEKLTKEDEIWLELIDMMGMVYPLHWVREWQKYFKIEYKQNGIAKKNISHDTGRLDK